MQTSIVAYIRSLHLYVQHPCISKHTQTKLWLLLHVYTCLCATRHLAVFRSLGSLISWILSPWYLDDYPTYYVLPQEDLPEVPTGWLTWWQIFAQLPEPLFCVCVCDNWGSNPPSYNLCHWVPRESNVNHPHFSHWVKIQLAGFTVVLVFLVALCKRSCEKGYTFAKLWNKRNRLSKPINTSTTGY